MSKVYVVASGTKFPKCVQGIFATKAHAVEAMALGRHKSLRGPFEMDLGSTWKITAPVKRKQKSFHVRDVGCMRIFSRGQSGRLKPTE